MKKRMFYMLLATGVVFGLIFGYKAVGNYFMNRYFDEMPEPPAIVTATEVYEDQWRPATEAVGSFSAVNGAELTTELGGIVREIHFENGQRVESGQRLISLDVEADEAELERLQAAAGLAQLEMARFERLYRQNSVSESELQRAQSEAAQAEAAVRSQQARIRQKILRAPFDGIAGIRRVNVGEYVSPGTPLVALEQLRPIYLEFQVAQRRVGQIESGDPVRASVDAFPDLEFSGEITAIEPRVSESTRTFRLQATLDNDRELLRPGMFGRVRLEADGVEIVRVIPQTAVKFNPYGNAVFVIEEVGDVLRVRQRLVRTGRTRGDLIAVTEGLEIGERVATSGLLKLRNDAVVEINDDGRVQPPADSDPRPENQ